MIEIVMPRLSDSMAEGTLLSWLKAEGDEVAPGDDLVEIETDKATMTYQSEETGFLVILGAEGEAYPVGAVIARLSTQPVASTAPVSQGPSPSLSESEPRRAPTSSPSPAAAESPPTPATADARTRVSPLARRLAQRNGVDLSQIAGSGPGGRIVMSDITTQAGVGTTPPPPFPREDGAGVEPQSRKEGPNPLPSAASSPESSPIPPKGDVTVVEPTRVQQVVARRMAESKATAPDFSMSIDAEIDRLIAMRDELKGVACDEQPLPSLNDFVVKAVALALRRHPKVNGAYRDQHFELYGRVNVGVAVAAPDGLFVPTVFDADRSSLGDITKRTRDLAKRARDNQLTAPELAGATFTVSNLGMYGVREFCPIINPPHAGILAVGAMREEPTLRDGALATRSLMPLALVGDHRILNGADAAEFLATLRSLIQVPLRMAL